MTYNEWQMKNEKKNSGTCHLSLYIVFDKLEWIFKGKETLFLEMV